MTSTLQVHYSLSFLLLLSIEGTQENLFFSWIFSFPRPDSLLTVTVFFDGTNDLLYAWFFAFLSPSLGFPSPNVLRGLKLCPPSTTLFGSDAETYVGLRLSCPF